MKVEANGIYDEDEVVEYIKYWMANYHQIEIKYEVIAKVLACELDYLKEKGLYE